MVSDKCYEVAKLQGYKVAKLRGRAIARGERGLGPFCIRHSPFAMCNSSRMRPKIAFPGSNWRGWITLAAGNRRPAGAAPPA